MKDFFKKHILRTYLLDAGFVLVLGIFLLYARFKLSAFLVLINSYAPQLDSIDSNLDAATAELLTNNLDSITNNMYILLIIVPIIVFLIYFIFQGASFYYLKKEKKYLIYFFVTSSFSYILFTLLLTKGINMPLSLVFLLIAYLTFLSYIEIKEENYMRLLKKSYVMFPVFFGYLILWIISLSLFLMVILKYAIDDLSYILFAGLGLLVLFGVSYYKILIVKKFS